MKDTSLPFKLKAEHTIRQPLLSTCYYLARVKDLEMDEMWASVLSVS